MTTAPVVTQSGVEDPPDPDLVQLRDLIYKVAGIFHPDNKLDLLRDRCRRRMKKRETETLREYLDCLTMERNGQVEMVALLNEITIGETCFFRYPPQLEALSRIVIPKIIETKRRLPSRKLRIWSAGCSTGEEPYTISISLRENASAVLRDWTIEILATDINECSLVHAKAGLYGNHSTRKLAPHFKQKYFASVGDKLQVLPIVRRNVVFSRVNLSEERQLASISDLDIVFCCNVLIYFDLASKRRVVQHFYNSLLPHGHLFLGHSESLYGVGDKFNLIHLPGATAYVKRRALGEE